MTDQRPGPGHLVVLANERSGRGRGRMALAHALPVLSAGSRVTVIHGADAADARTQLQAALGLGGSTVAPTGDQVRAVVAVGGDGTVHLALQQALAAAVPLGIIPAGTGNDGARSLGLPRHDPVAAARVVLAGRTRPVDVGRARVADGTTCDFLCVLSTGFDSAVNERANAMSFPPGQAKYLRAVLAELRHFRAAEYRVTIDGRTRDLRAMLVTVGNGPSYGGGMRVCPQADLGDGLLDVLTLDEVAKLDFARTFPRVYRGTHVSHPMVSQQRGREITISAEGPIAYADGERIGELPVQVQARPGALRALVEQGPDRAW